MTTYLSSDLLTQLQPLCGSITSMTQFESKRSNSKSRKEEAEAERKREEVIFELHHEKTNNVVYE